MHKLTERSNLSGNEKVTKAYQQLNNLLFDLEQKKISTETIAFLNSKVDELNAMADTDSLFLNAIQAKEKSILKWVEKKHHIVPKNYYRNMWMVVGMSAFGLPFGVAYGIIIDNLAFLGIGLPIGMAIGIAVGASMDKKAVDEGRQLDYKAE